MFIDTHTHMDHRRFDSDRNAILNIARNSGIEVMINPSIDFETNYTMGEKLDVYDWIFYGLGIHPNRVGTHDIRDEVWESGLLKLAAKDNRKVVAIGETGLDFHRLSRNCFGQLDENGIVSLSRQYKWFRKQIQLASMLNLPLILHIRNANEENIRSENNNVSGSGIDYIDAHKEAIKILSEFQDDLKLEIKGVVHCFNSNQVEDAIMYTSMGYFLGIGGSVTFSQNEGLREIVRIIPIDSIVLETDCPYVMPEGLAGKRNTPINIPYIARTIADLKGMDVNDVERITTDNAKRLFRLNDF